MKNTKQIQADLLAELMDNFRRVNPYPADQEGVVKPRFDLDAMKKYIREENDFTDGVNKYNAKMQNILIDTYGNEIKELRKEFKKGLDFKDGDMYVFYQDKQKEDLFATSYITLIKEPSEKEIEVNAFYQTTYVSIILDNGKEVGLRAIVGLLYTTQCWNYIEDKSTFFAESFDALIQKDIKLQQAMVELIKK
jgi:hypothetical protein